MPTFFFSTEASRAFLLRDVMRQRVKHRIVLQRVTVANTNRRRPDPFAFPHSPPSRWGGGESGLLIVFSDVVWAPAAPRGEGDRGILGQAVAALGRPLRRQRRFSRDVLAPRPNPQRCSSRLIKTTLLSSSAAAPLAQTVTSPRLTHTNTHTDSFLKQFAKCLSSSSTHRS